MTTMSAAEKRAQAKVEYDAPGGLPSRLLARISDKWVALVLAALGSGGPYPGDDRWRAAGDAVLSWPGAWPGSARRCSPRTLRSLERDGFPNGDADGAGHGHLRADRPRLITPGGHAHVKTWRRPTWTR